jgi:RNA polymerase subunit RPABC4/transcription elongation factor Spt4
MLIACGPPRRSCSPTSGAIVYMIVRPPEYLDDVRERELEIQAAEARMHALDYHLCPHCDYEVKGEFLRCPNCMRKLKDRCHNCAKPLDPDWKLCPYCEAEIPGVTPAPRSRRRRRSSEMEETAAFEPFSEAPPQ